MNYSITITTAGFDLTLQTTNQNAILGAMSLAEGASGQMPKEIQPLPEEIKVEGGPLTFAKGTLADVFSKEAEVERDPAKVKEEMLQKTNPDAAPDADVFVEPLPLVKPAKPAAARKTAKPAAAAPAHAPAPAKEDPAVQILIPSPPENLKALQDETASLTMEAIGRNRPAVIALMGEFGATKFSDIKTDPAKLKGFRARIESITDKTMLDDNGKLV